MFYFQKKSTLSPIVIAIIIIFQVFLSAIYVLKGLHVSSDVFRKCDNFFWKWFLKNYLNI